MCKALCQRNWCLLYLHPELKQEKEETAASKACVSSNAYIVLVSLMAVSLLLLGKLVSSLHIPVVASRALSGRLILTLFCVTT